MTATVTTWTKLLDVFFEDALVGRCLVAPDGTILRANAEWLRSKGLTRNVVGEDVAALFPEARDMTLALHRRARAGHRVEVPRHAQLVNGRATWWDGNIEPVPMEGGAGLLITVREVSDAAPRAVRDSTAEILNAASERLAQDLDAMTRLHRLSARFVRAGDLPQVLEEIVDLAISITHADQGNIQLLDPASRRLKVAAYRGHERWWLDFFESVAEGKGASCGAALQQGARAIVEDVTTSPIFVGTPALEVQLRAGIRAVQSTPLFGSSGELVGMISTHYRTPHRPDARDLRLLDLLARQAADMIEHVRSEESLRESDERFRAFVMASSEAVYRMSPDWSEMRELRGRDFIADSPIPSSVWLDKYIHPDDQPLVTAKIAEAIRTKSTFELEHRVRRVDGTLGWTFSRAIPLLEANGAIKEWFGAASDITARKQAEEALLRHRELLERVFEKIPVLLVMWDPRLQRFTLNRKAEEVLGLSSAEANERDLMSAVYPSAEYRAEAVAFMQSLHPRFREWIGRSKSGEDVPIAWANIRLADETMIGVGVDLRERKQAEEALRESEERFRLLVQGVKDYAIYMLAPDGTVKSWNAGAEQIFGYRQDEVVGQYRALFFTEEGRRAREPERALEEAAATGRCRQEGLRIRKDGSPFHADVLITAVRDDAGQLRGFANVTRDVTERRTSEAALRESEQRLRLAQQVARTGSFSWDLQSGVNTWTAELEALYGLSPGGFGGTETAFEQLIHPEDRDQVVRWVDRAMETGAPSEGEWRAVWPDGSVHWIAGRWQVLKDGFCKPIRMTGINFDITEQKRSDELRASEAALREANRQKDQFLGMLSHELRNPLAPIRSSSYILRHAEPGSEQVRRAHDVIERQTEHLTRLVDDLLDMTRVARGKIALQRSSIDLREVVSHAADDFRARLQGRGVHLEVDVPEEKLWVDADATRLTQIIGNLLNNAAKFTRMGDQVAVVLGAVDGNVEIHVRDTGVGIEPSLLPRIFDAFVQGDRTLARSEGGLGLGLALVKALTELHGGTVRAESAGTGEGAEFVVRLPLLAAPVAEFPHAPPAERRVRARRVLVVDDNADAAESLAEVVEMLGHAVEVAYDGPSAIEKVRSNRPDVVLCDIGLPGMSGYEVARRLRASAVKGIRLVAVSGYAQPEDVARATEAGFDAHVAKPLDAEELARIIGGQGPLATSEPLDEHGQAPL